MARRTFSETRKSKWLGDKERKPRREPKPLFPLVEGTLECKARIEGKPCGNITTVQAHAEVVITYPKSVFWYVGYCEKCLNSLIGYATLGEDTEA